MMAFFPAWIFGQVCLEGTVTLETAGIPAVHAMVYVPENDLVTYTDEQGFFSLCGAFHGTVTLQVKHSGFRTHVQTVTVTDSLLPISVTMWYGNQELGEVYVYADRIEKPEESSNSIATISAENMRDLGAMSLSDGIARLPGVQQLSTGPGISKPVIRGLFGNRIQTVMLGLRFDNQQWQDEHGLGLSDVGVDRVEIIKGPASLLFGPEAMGGVVHILEEKPAPIGNTEWNLTTKYFSNTTGLGLDVGVKGSKPKFYWRLRAGSDSHADYSDGNNQRVLNSRFGGYYFKGSAGFRGEKWSSLNQYFFSLSNFGFIMEGGSSFMIPDARQSRSFQLPHHSVYLHVFSSQNKFQLKRSHLKWTLGVQANDRQEQEGGNKISLNMLLNSYSSTLLWVKPLSERTEWSLGTQDMYQTNVNLGSRTIVPDATLIDGSVYSYIRHRRKILMAEAGLRYGIKYIATRETGTLNAGGDNPGSTILPFTRWYQALNGAAGISLYHIRFWKAKLNFSSGYRPGNLAELSSNGVHEGSIRYEIGNTDLRTEQNICVDLSTGIESRFIDFNVSGYLNRFFNYIYLQPTADEYIGYQIFRYVQKNALLKGAEAQLEIHPPGIPWIRLQSTYSTVIGQTDAGDYLPFIPAQELNTALTFPLRHPKIPLEGFIRIATDYFFAQNRPGQFETATADYALLNAAIGASFRSKRQQFHLGVSGNNLLNRVYAAHLSRYKYFGISNIGRNIAVQFSIQF